jgi:hypothetical protein
MYLMAAADISQPSRFAPFTISRPHRMGTVLQTLCQKVCSEIGQSSAMAPVSTDREIVNGSARYLAACARPFRIGRVLSSATGSIFCPGGAGSVLTSDNRRAHSPDDVLIGVKSPLLPL